jgi:putative transposase
LAKKLSGPRAVCNHLHGIIWIDRVGAGLALPYNENERNKGGPSPAPTLANAICAFKSKTPIRINRFRNVAGNPEWQRNYYGRIIHNEDELPRARNYINENPSEWDQDPKILKA